MASRFGEAMIFPDSSQGLPLMVFSLARPANPMTARNCPTDENKQLDAAANGAEPQAVRCSGSQCYSHDSGETTYKVGGHYVGTFVARDVFCSIPQD